MRLPSRFRNTALVGRRSRDDIIDAIRSLKSKGLRATESVMQRELGAAFLRETVRRFGSVSAARDAAGIVTKRSYRTRADIREGLRALHARGVRLVPKELVDIGEARIVSAIYRHYSSFPTALRAAGLKKSPPRKPKPVSLEEAQGHLLKVAKELRDSPPKGRIRGRFARRLAEEYGDWNSVLEAVGLSPRLAPNQRWTKQTIIEGLRDFHRSGTPITISSLKAVGAVDLVSATDRHFGRFGAARDAAGIAPPRRRGSSNRTFEHLSRSQVRRARERYAAGRVTARKLAEGLGVSRAVMGRLLRHESMSEAGGPMPKRRSRLAPRQVVTLRRRFAAGASCRALATIYSLPIGTVYAIVTGRTYREIGGPTTASTRAPKRGSQRPRARSKS